MVEEDRRRRTKQKGGARGWAACSRREEVHRWCTQPRAVLSGWARACSYTIHARRTCTRCRLTSGAVLRGLVMLRVRAMAPDTRLPRAQKRRSRQAPCSAPVAQRSWSPDIAVGKRARRTSARRVCYRQTALQMLLQKVVTPVISSNCSGSSYSQSLGALQVPLCTRDLREI